MEIEGKVLEQFHYFNIQADVDSVFGNWAVSKNGDVVNSVFPFVILAIHLNDTDWLEKLKSKVWFKSEYEIDLKMALKKAELLVFHRNN